MAKGLDFQRGVYLLTDGADFFQTAFPCQHHPLRAQIKPCLSADVIGDGLLGGNMPLAVRGIFPGQGECAQVGHDQGVHPGVVQLLQIFRQPDDFVISWHGVHGDVTLDTMVMGVPHRLGQLLGGEIPREGAHSKACSGEIYRVCAVGYGHFQPLHVPGRAEQFQLSHSPSDCVEAAAAAAANCARYCSCSSCVVEN